MNTTKNLGLVRAIFVGLNPPANVNILWYDDNVGQKIHKYYDVVTSAWIPLGGGSGGGASLAFNGNRAITRAIPSLYGVNVNTADIPSFLEKVFFVAENPVLSISISGGPVKRFGSSPAVTLAWGVTKKTLGVTSISVDTQSFAPSAGINDDSDPSGNSQSGTKNGTGTQNVNTTFTMTVVDSASNSFNASVASQYTDERFWFVSSVDLMSQTNTQLSNLLNTLGSGRELANGRQQGRSFSPSGQFIYFAWKSSYGGNPLTDFVVNGLPNTAWQQVDFTYTNDAAVPYVSTFKLTRSQNLLSANFNVTVN